MSDPKPSVAPPDPNHVAQSTRRRRSVAIAQAITITVLTFAAMSVVPALYCSRRAAPLLAADPSTRMLLVRGAAFQGEEHEPEELFSSGSARHDGEWLLATYALTAMAAGQSYLGSPGTFEEAQLIGGRATTRIVLPTVRQFDVEAWQGNDALYSLGDDQHGHVAYLGYLALALGWDRVLQSHDTWHDLHDGVVAALERRLSQSKTGVIASYPDEYFPAHIAVAIAAVDLHARIQGKPAPAWLDEWEQRFRAHCIDPQSGLLWALVGPEGKLDHSPLRATTTAMAAWLLTGARPKLADDLYQALLRERYQEVLGFAGVREYPVGDRTSGDIDSGPLILGLSPAATAFTLGAARARGDTQRFTRLYASAYLAGAPVNGDQRRNFVVAGPLGDAVLASTVTALSAERYTEGLAEVVAKRQP